MALFAGATNSLSLGKPVLEIYGIFALESLPSIDIFPSADEPVNLF